MCSVQNKKKTFASAHLNITLIVNGIIKFSYYDF